MTISETPNIINLNITSFPNHLLISNIDNVLSFQAINNSNKSEKFKIVFNGENLDISISEDLKETIQLNPGESKNIDLKLIPTASGSGKFTIIINWMKLVEYTVKVQKVRDVISTPSKVKDIFKIQALPFLKSLNNFNLDDYTISMTNKELKQAEKQLRKSQSEYSSNSESKTEITIEEIDNNIKRLAKGYLSSKNPQKALEFALELSTDSDKLDFYYSLIIAQGFIDLDATFQIINDLREIKILQIDIELLKIKLLFNLAKTFNDQDKKPQSIKVLNKIIDFIVHSTKFDLLFNNFNNQSYEFVKDAACALAEIDCPKTADSIIEGLLVQELKEKIAMDLFTIIYEMVDETKTKLEPTVVFSQYYLFNIYTSNITEQVKDFSKIGGNLSNNLIVKDFNFNFAFISLFGFNFSIFPIMERAYSDLKRELDKSFAYYIFPSKKNHDEKELITINSTLNQFMVSNLANKSEEIFIYNLDFIPYLGKPTIIISSEPELSEYLISRIKPLEESINLIIDDSLFKGGSTLKNLKNLFPPSKCKIVNLILSYEFINEYNLFKTFIKLLL